MRMEPETGKTDSIFKTKSTFGKPNWLTFSIIGELSIPGNPDSAAGVGVTGETCEDRRQILKFVILWSLTWST
jgi:hypothetical protein